jgi:hypothetical protein
LTKIISMEQYVPNKKEFITAEWERFFKHELISRAEIGAQAYPLHLSLFKKYCFFVRYVLEKTDPETLHSGEILLLKKVISDLEGIYACISIGSLNPAYSSLRSLLETNYTIRLIYEPYFKEIDWANRFEGESYEERIKELHRRMGLFYNFPKVQHYSMIKKSEEDTILPELKEHEKKIEEEFKEIRRIQ